MGISLDHTVSMNLELNQLKFQKDSEVGISESLRV